MLERRSLGQRRRAAAEVDRLEPRGEQRLLERELGEDRLDVAAVLPVVADDGDEVAVAAARRAERQVDVQVLCARHGSVLAARAPDELAAAVRADVLHRLGTGRAERALVRADRGVGAVVECGAAALARGPHLERHYFFALSFRLSTARNASCGTSTPPTDFIRFLPFFCFSSSFRLREMSPP